MQDMLLVVISSFSPSRDYARIQTLGNTAQKCIEVLLVKIHPCFMQCVLDFLQLLAPKGVYLGLSLSPCVLNWAEIRAVGWLIFEGISLVPTTRVSAAQRSRRGCIVRGIVVLLQSPQSHAHTTKSPVALWEESSQAHPLILLDLDVLGCVALFVFMVRGKPARPSDEMRLRWTVLGDARAHDLGSML